MTYFAVNQIFTSYFSLNVISPNVTKNQLSPDYPATKRVTIFIRKWMLMIFIAHIKSSHPLSKREVS